MRIGAIIQARVSSTRLPGKILKELPSGSGITVLEHVIRRLKRSKKLDDIIIATTFEPGSGRIVKVAKKEKVKFFKGDTKNVLSRYYLAAKKNGLDLIVRITSDCPCCAPEVVDLIIEKHLAAKVDYTSNTLKRTYPLGLNAEVFSFDTLEKAYKMAKEDYDKEHVTPYIYRNPSKFSIKQVKSPPSLNAPGIRITLDTQEDYALLCEVFNSLYYKNKHFTAYDIVHLFKEKPWLNLINGKVVQKKFYANLKSELKELAKISEVQGLKKAKGFITKCSSGAKAKNHEKKPAAMDGIDTRLGKPLDIVSFKSDVVNNFSSHVSKIKSIRKTLFKSKRLQNVTKCPVCGASSKNSTFATDVYGGRFHECQGCTHCYLINRPGKSELKNFYTRNARYALTYTSRDKKALSIRLRDVVRPKAEWTVEKFKKLYGRKPRTILDVGAGAGHFVHVCREMGMDAHGIELSKSCIQFSKKIFDIDLEPKDFVSSWKDFSGIDIVTFWGVIEHTPNPVELLKAAHKLLRKHKDGLVVTEVPRWDSLSTMVQRLFPDSVVRHLDPLGHVSLFTDRSLSAAFEKSSFLPVSRWYFGMDAYELLIQLANMTGEGRIMQKASKHINDIQGEVDNNLLSDIIVLAGKPIR